MKPTHILLILLAVFFSSKGYSSSFSETVAFPPDTGKIKEQAREYAAKAQALHEYVKAAKNIVHQLDLTKTYTLPLGISKTIGSIEYLIVIESIMLTPEGGLLTAYMSLQLPNSDKKLSFRGTDIKVSSGGISGIGRLELIENFPIKLSEQMQLNLVATENKTYVNFDCDGFKNMGIQAELEFSRDLIIPEDSIGELHPSKRVKAAFEIPQMQEWGDLIVKLNLPPFQIRGLNGFGFHVKDAVFDFSEINNVPDIQYPLNYHSSNPDASTPYWQGVYIRDVSVRLPKQFHSTAQGSLEIGGSHLIIDDMGFTGQLRALDILSIDKGRIGTWPFAVDSLGLTIQANQVTSGGFLGRLITPLFDRSDPVFYSAIINTGGNYIFNVTTTGTKSIPLWAAEADIYPGSSIEVKVAEEKFLPKLIIHGKLSVSAGKDTDVSLADINFENLELQTVKPYLKVGSFGLSSDKEQQKMSGFPVTLNEVGVRNKENKTGIILDLAVNLVGDSSGFSAKGNMTVWGNQKEEDGQSKWQFEGIELNKLGINVDGGAFKLKGLIASYEQDPLYGKGFKGSIDATFTPGLVVNATAQFGRKDFRYWYVDALAITPAGITVVPGFALYGFGGGAYYKMKQTAPSKGVVFPDTASHNPLDTSFKAGKSLSGISYIPDAGTNLGIKATVIVGTHPSPKAFNADATFEIAFSAGGGIDYVGLAGNAFFMTPLDKRSAKAPVYAGLKIDYDIPNSILFANLTVHMNVGSGAVKGTGTDNLAGSAVMYFAPSDWHIHIGTPDKRVSVKLMKLFEANSYFMVGTSMPPMPEPPSNITDILGGDFNFMRDENALAGGGGFAFGSSVFITTGDLSFLVFYARLDAGAGFDLMLKDYGPGVRCAGRTEELGINGWYASGQAYAYVQGKVGIRVDLSFIKGEYEILDIGAAAILQAKLPNPFWMRGTVGGYYSILGGLISGDCRFEATLGEQCELMGGGSVVADIRIIQDISPATGAEDISVFNAPQAVFSMEVGKIFEMVDFDDQKKSFRIALDHFKILDGDTEIPVVLSWNESNDVAALQSVDVLPAEKDLKVVVKVHFEQFIDNSWHPAISKGKVVEETAEAIFRTGTAPDNIPLSNVLFSYPIVDQYNFYKDEYGQGYIQLKQGQDYLFQPNPAFNQLVRFESASGKLDFNFTYDAEANRINYNIPSGLVTDKGYQFSLVNVPANDAAAIDQNVSSGTENLTDVEGTTVNIAKKQVQGTLDIAQETTIFNTVFRTSKYATFSEKFNALTLSKGWIWSIAVAVDELRVNVSGQELFDGYEITGSENFMPLIQFEADPENKWFRKEIRPLVYPAYPVNGELFITWRQTGELGIPPLQAIEVRQNPDNIRYQPYGGTEEASGAVISYNLPFYACNDFYDLRQQAAIHYLRNSNSQLSNLLTTSFTPIRSGNYKIKIKYVLPGIGIASSEKEISINNP